MTKRMMMEKIKNAVFLFSPYGADFAKFVMSFFK